jgi:hypothetical protein
MAFVISKPLPHFALNHVICHSGIPGQTVRRWLRRSVPLELPRGEAPDVDVELVEARVVAVASELDLELQLILGYGTATDGAFDPDTRTTPSPIRCATR